jgi:uncharacterized protein YgbK (DUF1537 family)
MQLPGLKVGVIADDLTGASDTALQFFRAGSSANILVEPSAASGFPEAQVWSVNVQSRHKEVKEAVQAVRQATAMLRDHYGVENFYKKMDSTLRGHLAMEALAMLDELNADCMVIAPAYPAEGRRTVGGYQLVRGVPVEKTDASRDPLCPVRQSHVPTLLKQSLQKQGLDEEMVGHIELSTVLHGAGPILIALSDLIKQGKRLVVVDACSSVDLEQVALAIEKSQNHSRVIPGGAAGLAHALTKYWKADENEELAIEPQSFPQGLKEAPILLLSGSNTQLTRHQVQQLQEHYSFYGEGSALACFELTPEEILGQVSLDSMTQKVLEQLGRANTVVVGLSLTEDNYYKTRDLALSLGMVEEDVPIRGQSLIAQLAQRVKQAQSVKLVLTGGETATHVSQQLGVKCFSVKGTVEPAIPLLQDDSGRWMVTKSGNFGSPLAIANIVHFLKQQERLRVV